MSHTVEYSHHEDDNGMVVDVTVHQYPDRGSPHATANDPRSAIYQSTQTHPRIPQPSSVPPR